jgi:ketosteroid isomerase-like protein
MLLGVTTSWQSFRDQVRSAVEAFVAGDAEPYKRCWSREDDCTAFGAFGGVVRGGEEIASRLDWAATRYREGRYVRFDVLADGADGTLGYLVHVERIESLDPEGGVVVRERRATHIARREGDGWRVVHHHADPLVEVAKPA